MSGTDLFVQSLVASRNGNPTARWNFPACVGSKLDSLAGVGTAVTLSYGFLDSAPLDYSWGTGFQTFTTAYREAAGRALQILSSVARINFTPGADARNASIRFGRNSQPAGQGGYAWLPGYGYSFNPATGSILSVTESPSSGDVWLNTSINYSSAELSQGGQGLQTLVHELGHAVGLRHPFETPNQLSAAYDNKRYTVMSYTPAARSTRVDLRLTGGGGYSYTTRPLEPRSLMVGDIAALQYLYGANNSFNAGDNSYRYTDADLFLETIWDGGGKDTIDCSALSYACTISLEAGKFSSIGLRSGEAQLRQLHNIPAGISFSDPNFWSDLYDGSNNLAIAYGCLIENCIGSQANDTISGNALANRIDGRGGSDTMAGLAGNDTYLVDQAGDTVIETLNNGIDSIESSINLTLPANIENLKLVGSARQGTGNALANRLTGNSRANQLSGGAAADQLIGRGGADTLTGGEGLDRFVYVALGDSGVGAAKRDQITDFQGSAGEQIDLSQIDAFSGAAGNQAFVYIDGAAFSGLKGEVRFASGILQINTGVDMIADMEIALTGLSSFHSAFLVL